MEYTELQSTTKVSDTPAILNGNFANIKTELEGKVDASRLKAVATSGSYNDLTDKPTIPAAYDDTALTERVTVLEQSGGSDVDTSNLVDLTSEQNITGTKTFTSPIINTSYFRTPTMVGEGDNSTYYHRMECGRAGHNHWDWYDYGGAYNFYQCTTGAVANATLVGAINPTNGWQGKVNGFTIGADVPADLGTRLTALESALTDIESGEY